MNSIFDKYYKADNNIWGDPQTYKTIKIYPLRIYQQREYDDLCKIFSFCKEQIQDAKIAKMSYLKFLICIVPQVKGFEDLDSEKELISFLKTVVKTENIKILSNQTEEDKETIVFFLSTLGLEVSKTSNLYKYYTLEQLSNLKFTIEINDKKFSENDFEIIREIILKQNGLDLDHIRQYDPSLEESLRFLCKGDAATFEEYVFSVSAVMKTPIYNIKEQYTIYQFYKTIERLNMSEDYQALKALEAAGFVKLKKGDIPHWLSHSPKKGRYDDLLVEKESFMKNNDIFKASKTK